MALDADTLYLLIGEGDTLSFPPPAVRVNIDGPNSPIFNSILKIQFSADLDRLRGTFRLTSPDDWALLDGYAVYLENSLGERANVQLLTAFRPLVRNVLGGPNSFRQSNPFGAALDAKNRTLWVTDAGMETVTKVDTITGRYQVLFRFEPLSRSNAAGPVLADNVPSGACLQGDQVLVGMFTASPQGQGEASIWSFDTRSPRVGRPTINGFTAVADIVCAAEGVYVLEASAPAVPTLRVSVVQRGATRVLAEEPGLPGGMAQDPVSGDIFVTRIGFGDTPNDVVRVTPR